MFIKENEDGVWVGGSIISETADVFISFSEDIDVGHALSLNTARSTVAKLHDDTILTKSDAKSVRDSCLARNRLLAQTRRTMMIPTRHSGFCSY